MTRPDDERLAESDGGLDGGDLAVRRDGVGGEQHARSVGGDHLLHDHGHRDGAVVDAVAQAICHGPIGEQRCHAPADVLDDRGRPGDVQEGVVLTCERRSRQVLRRRARPNGVGRVRAEPVHRIGDRRRDIVGDGDGFDRPAHFGTERADGVPIVGIQIGESLEQIVDRRSDSDDSPERVRGHTESGRHGDAVEPRQLAEMCALSADDIDLCSVDLVEPQHPLVDRRRLARWGSRVLRVLRHRVVRWVHCAGPFVSNCTVRRRGVHSWARLRSMCALPTEAENRICHKPPAPTYIDCGGPGPVRYGWRLVVSAGGRRSRWRASFGAPRGSSPGSRSAGWSGCPR